MMTRQSLEEFILFLKKSQWEIFGTQKKDGLLSVDLIKNPQDLRLEKELPFFSLKHFFVPEKETLFEYRGAELKSPSIYKEDIKEGSKKTALFGVNILDLKSFLLYDQVFERDPYYQERRQNILVIGHSILPSLEQNIFEQTFEEDTLEHLSFDIFFGAVSQKGGEGDEFAVFTGSLAGQKILENFGYKEYIHIQFSGPVKGGKLDSRMLKLKEKLENHHNQKIWDELGARCIECGKCTIVCPTCFCFRNDDFSSLDKESGQRQRCWDSCYFQEFSEVAGGHKFLNNTAKRIHFWYFHKFGRIPREFNFMGCVGCRRCAAVCPVGIDIADVLKDIERS